MSRPQLAQALLSALLVAVLLVTLAIQLVTPRLASADEGTFPVCTADDIKADGPEVRVLVMGPGDRTFTSFGHAAVWLHDPTHPKWMYTDRVVNWGYFDSKDPNLFRGFFERKTKYWVSDKDPLTWTLGLYKKQQRELAMLTLNLTPEQTQRAIDDIDQQLTPENRFYFYDWFHDNCATRIRDTIDRTVDGQVAEQTQQLTDHTERSETLRLMQPYLHMAVGIHYGLTYPTDARLTAWETMFLPDRLAEVLPQITLRDAEGNERPLIKNACLLVEGKRGDVTTPAPNYTPWLILIGLLVLAATLGLGWLSPKYKAARITLGVGVTLSGIPMFVLGLILTYFWAFSKLEIIHGNENLLLTSPLNIAMLPLGIAFAAGWTRTLRVVGRPIAFTFAVLAILALLINAIPGLVQPNIGFIVLLGAPQVAFAWALHRYLEITDAPSGEDGDDPAVE